MLLREIYKPVYEEPKATDNLRFSVYCANQKRLGQGSSLTYLFNDKLYEPNLLSMIFEMVEDSKPFPKPG